MGRLYDSDTETTQTFRGGRRLSPNWLADFKPPEPPPPPPPPRPNLLQRIGQGIVSEVRPLGSYLAKEAAFAVRHPIEAAKTTGRFLTANVRALGQTVGDIAAANILTKTNEELLRQKQKDDQTLLNLIRKTKDPLRRDRLIKMLHSSNQIDILKEAPSLSKSNLQVLGEVAGTGLDLLTAGILTPTKKVAGEAAGLAGKEVAQEALPKLLQKGTPLAKSLAKTAALGAAYNTTVALQEGVNKPEELLKKAEVGAATGLVLDLGGRAAFGALKGVAGKVGGIIKTIGGKGTPEMGVGRLISYEGAPDRARVEEYKKIILNRGVIEPLKIVDEGGGKFGVLDGQHRLQAYKELGITKVPVEVVQQVKKTSPATIDKMVKENERPKTVAELLKIKPERPGEIADKTAKMKDFPAPPKEKAVRLTAGFDPGLDKFYAEDVKPQIEKAVEAGNVFYKSIQYIKNALLKGVDPMAILEKRFGREVGADVVKAFHLHEAAAEVFNQQRLQTFDKNYGELERWFGKFSLSDLKNFNLIRGVAEGDKAKLLQIEAQQKLQPELKNSTLMKALNEIANFNINLAKNLDIEIDAMKDYFYGSYKNNKGEVDRFIEYWKTTDRYTKEKVFPTFADAAAWGLELKNPNPVTNLKEEVVAIARRGGMMQLKKAVESYGQTIGKKIENASEAELKIWQKIKDPVFEGYLFHPDFARVVNNLLEVNKITKGGGLLSFLQKAARVNQTIKFSGSAFHWKSMFEASVAASGGGVINPMGYWDFLKSFKGLSQLQRQSPEYIEYLALGGGHKYALEVETVGAWKEMFEKMTRGNMIGALGKGAKGVLKAIPATPQNIEFMFEEYIPALKFQKYLNDVKSLESKLGRSLTDGEKITIIKRNQDFYGEMNERLFGRSATVTSLLRLIFTAPGYGEGNFRTLVKALRGDAKSAMFIVNSLIFTATAATITSRLLTGKWPAVPKKLEDLRDVFKAHTGILDKKGKEILIDMMGYDKDYWTILSNLASGQPGQMVKELGQRISGATSTNLKMLTDLSTLFNGGMVYDWKGEPLYYQSDTFKEKFNKLLSHFATEGQPISLSTLLSSSKQLPSQNKTLGAISALFGFRTTTSEEAKRNKTITSNLYELLRIRTDKQSQLNKMFVENPEQAQREADLFNEKQQTKVADLLRKVGKNPDDYDLSPFLVGELHEPSTSPAARTVEELMGKG